MPEPDGRTRVIIENLTPQVDDGAFPIKRIVGDTVTVEADVFTDGHDVISCVLLYKKEGDSEWTEAPMEPLVNDRWQGSFKVQKLGRYLYTVSAWTASNPGRVPWQNASRPTRTSRSTSSSALR
jgi:starch synthase (maltosyl-transferring)